VNWEVDFEMPPFIPIFIGLRDNLVNGEFTLPALGLYTLLHLRCDWSKGIYVGTAEGLSGFIGRKAGVQQIQKYLLELKEARMINYRDGDGARKNYPILINKYLVRTGSLKGWTLDAFASNALRAPVYERGDSREVVEGWSRDGGVTVEWQSQGSHEVVAGPIQEIKNINKLRIEESTNRKRRYKTRVVVEQTSNVPETQALPQLTCDSSEEPPAPVQKQAEPAPVRPLIPLPIPHR
jgi:hypothetical protein